MIDLRYHLASIVAIFFALGIGMLTGAQLANEGTLTQEHARLIAQIEASVERVRADNRRLSDELTDARHRLEAEQAFVADMLAELVSAQLEGVPVDIVATAGATSYAGRVQKTLQQAGADVAVWDETAVTHGQQRPAFTLFLWGEADEPYIPPGTDGMEPVTVGADGEVDTVAEELLSRDVTARATVWGWPVAAASRSELPAVEGVPSVPAVDTPKGLLTLIEILRAEAGRPSSPADGNS